MKMRFSSLLFSVVSGLLMGDSLLAVVDAKVITTTTTTSFHRDVVSKVAKKERRQLPIIGGKASSGKPTLEQQQLVQDELLSKAIPLAEYNRQLKSLGVVDLPPAESRILDENNNIDDYYMNEQYMYSFSGFSMKYARCQPIQQFSEEALAAGEYSPMVTQDVVILRLCPYKSCSSSRQYGCHYNYAEYAIGLNDYIRIMLRRKEESQERLCEFCTGCQERRKLDEEAQDQEEVQQDNGEDQNDGYNNAAADDYYKYQGQDDAYYAANNNNNNNNDDANYNNYYDENDECYIYGSYCENYSYDCAEDDAEQNNGNYYDDQYYNNQQQANYIDLEEYYNYLGCTELADSYGGIYFVRPTCDSSSATITMAVYYDEYCSQSASSVANMDNFQVAFDNSVFQELYSGECMDCSESNYPPAFNANSYMCNKIHYAGAGCTTNMVYDLFDGQSSDSTECSFIESIRFGTYDSTGAIAVEAGEDAEEVVTTLQKIGLATSAFICTAFVMYACYLHHSMTNLLIKSLSHRELLPPSRHSKRRSPSKSSKRSRRSSKSSKSSRRSDEDDDDDEWDRSKPLRSPV